MGRLKSSQTSSDSTPAPNKFKIALKEFEYITPPGKCSSSMTLDDHLSRRPTRSSSRVLDGPQSTIKTSSYFQSPSKRPSSSKLSTKRSSALKRKRSSGYAPPSKYAGLSNNLTDALEANLICVFIGLNPGLTTAATGYAYAHPSNLFWKLLASSGCTPRRCLPSETYDLTTLYGLGNTNIVARPTATGAELSRSEMDSGVALLDQKMDKYRPQAVAIVGKGIWESIWRVWKGRAIEKDEFKYGWQDDKLRMGRPHGGKKSTDGWKGALVFVAPSTSGLAATMRPAQKEVVWRQLGEWIEAQRVERGFVGNRSLRDGNVITE